MDLSFLKNKNFYNLIVTSEEDAWIGNTYKFDKSRFLEFTENIVKVKFKDIYSKEVINEIKSLPCLFLNEIGRGDFGYVGYITEIKARTNFILIDFEKIEQLNYSVIKELGLKLDIDLEGRGITELMRTHWAIKRVDLLEELKDFMSDSSCSILNPKVFISYSWESDKTKEIVEILVEKLEANDIEVIYDKKNLRLGQDMFYFMEELAKDASIKKVLVICDKSYQKKANNRRGGVGTESEIIIDEVYGKPLQNKIIPIFIEKDENNVMCVPIFLKSRYGVDFSSGFNEKKYDELKKDIFS